MLKRLILSVFLITMTVTAVATATYAYFSDGDVLSGNTFAAGEVNLNGFNKANITVTGLIPGVPKVVENVGINYVGSINADLYVGARGTSAPTDPTYIADKLYLRIYNYGTTDLVWKGYANELSTTWVRIANNVGAGWYRYDLQFTLDADAGNDYQGLTNTDTEIVIYAVQDNGPVPTLMPYETYGVADWFDL